MEVSLGARPYFSWWCLGGAPEYPYPQYQYTNEELVCLVILISNGCFDMKTHGKLNMIRNDYKKRLFKGSF